jgi:acetylornithine deacetylase/succinyl-diaminopimelate desuccinylase-like protein
MVIDFNEMLDAYKRILKIPSMSAKGTGINEAASFLKALLKNMGIKSEIIQTSGNPVVYGEYFTGAPKTLLVYNHYDVQPIDPENEWTHEPFAASEDNGRIYARGAADNKGTLMARIFGIEKALENNELHVNLKFLYEGEEEIGSPNLKEFIVKNKDRFAADDVIMEGSQVGEENRPVIALGVKGLLYVELKSRTGTTDLHSSLAAIAPSPAWNLINALDSVYDNNKVEIPGFYDNITPLSNNDLNILKDYPFNIERMKSSYGLKNFMFDDKERIIKELFTSPTCNIAGIISGYAGEGAKTVLPAEAKAKVDFRLVPDQDPEIIFDSMKDYLRKMGFDLEMNPLGMEYPVRTAPDTELAQKMISSAIKTYGRKPIIMLNSPGTQPMDLFTRELGIKNAVSAIGVGDNISKAHAPDESVSIENFRLAIEHTKNFLSEFQ